MSSEYHSGFPGNKKGRANATTIPPCHSPFLLFFANKNSTLRFSDACEPKSVSCMFPDLESTPRSPSHIPCLSVQIRMQWHSEQSSFITVAGPCRIFTYFHLSSVRASGSPSGEHNPFVFNYTVNITFCLEIFNPPLLKILNFSSFKKNSRRIFFRTRALI